jgi:hypothetical protein
MYVLYTTPANLRIYSDWDFKVHPGVFELEASAILHDLQTRRKRMLSHRPDLKHAKECIAKLQQIIPVHPEDAIVQLDQYLTDGLYITAGMLIPERKYRSAECPICDQRFSPTEITTHIWSFGEDLAADGGERYACPSGHTLYSLMHWNS